MEKLYTKEEFEILNSEIQIILNDIRKELDILKKEAKQETIYKKRLALQNSILMGFIKTNNLQEEYSEFSRQYMEWDMKNEK